jgi:hypothetical protein
MGTNYDGIINFIGLYMTDVESYIAMKRYNNQVGYQLFILAVKKDSAVLLATDGGKNAVVTLTKTEGQQWLDNISGGAKLLLKDRTEAQSFHPECAFVGIKSQHHPVSDAIVVDGSHTAYQENIKTAKFDELNLYYGLDQLQEQYLPHFYEYNYVDYSTDAQVRALMHSGDKPVYYQVNRTTINRPTEQAEDEFMYTIMTDAFFEINN